MNGQVSILSKS